MMNEQKSAIVTAVRLLRRYWIPAVAAVLLGIVLFAGQPAWAADGGAHIGQTVPTPTPAAPPVELTATPAPTQESGGDTGGDSQDGGETGGGAAAPVETAPAEAAPTETASAVSAEVPTNTATLTGTVTAVTLNVRQGPATTFPAIGRFTAGSNVSVLARNVDGTWLLVCCTTDGGTGWVSAEFVAPNFTAGEAAGLAVSNSLVTTATATSGVTGTVATAVTPLSGSGMVDVLTLNIRQGPSTSTAAVGRFRQGDTFTVQGTNAAGDWYLVCCIPGTQNAGWVSAQFATLGGAAPAADAEATPAATAEGTPAAAEATPAPTEPAAAATPAATPAAEATEAAGSTGSDVTDVLW